MGPFYSPSDEKIYIDPSFAQELKDQYGAQGNFAMAYVLAHEFGHHIQTLLGVSDQMARLQQTLSATQYNKYSVRMELQADYYAGVFTKWLSGQTYNGQPILEKDDVADAMKTAESIGDDTLETQAQGYANPDTFTHGTSAQRAAWFEAGYQYGDLEHGDTFNAKNLDKPDQ
jgi:predicted metalloprotease